MKSISKLLAPSIRSAMYTSLLLMFTLLSATGQKNSYVFTYDFDFQKYESTPDKREKAEALLIVGKKYVQFIDKLKYIADTTQKKSSSPTQAVSRTIEVYGPPNDMPSFRYSILKDKENQMLKYHNKVHTTTYHYEESFPEIDWHITEDTLQILDYLCQKAIGTFAGRRYEAWFSSEVPINHGPYKFGGLPGLIFKIADTEGKISYTLKGIESFDVVKVIPYTVKNRVTKKEYKKRLDHYYSDQKEYYPNRNGNITIDGRPVTMDEFYEGVKQEYLDEVKIEKI